MKKIALIFCAAIGFAAMGCNNDTNMNDNANDTSYSAPINPDETITDSTTIINDSVIAPVNNADSVRRDNTAQPNPRP